MKNIYHSISLAAILSCVAVGATANTILSEDFSNGFDAWTLYGSPNPQIAGVVDGESDVFDNNGDASYDSGIFSNTVINIPDGGIVESDVYVGFTDLSGCWSEASMYISRNDSPATSSTQEPETGIRWYLAARGDACWTDQQVLRRHAWFSFSLYAEDGSIESSGGYGVMSADNYVNGWHKAKFTVREDRHVEFYINDTLLWTSTKKVHTSILTGKRLVLGERSSASAGKTYHDNVLVTRLNAKPEISVSDGYIKLDVTSGFEPSAGDCLIESHHGRLVLDDVNEILYVCTGNGWTQK
jgi:hypothetical protein